VATPVIVVTDLYHPPEDPGDNVDIVLPFGSDRIDLRGIVLDAQLEKREDIARGVDGFPGPRDPGIIPVAQLNAIFGTQVPHGIGPFARMRSLTDRMDDIPAFQQTGVDLILRLLRESDEPVHLMSFGSARTIAVAFNREPELMRSRVARVHLSAGSSAPTYLEWNVYLDPLAVRRVVDSGLRLALYPCATGEDCYAADRHNTFWRLDDLAWVEGMHPALRRYLLYALSRSDRLDFLRVLDEEPAEAVKERVYARSHSVWETAAWLVVMGCAVVRHPAGDHEIVPAADVSDDDIVIPNRLVDCVATSREDGLYAFAPTGRETGSTTTVFEREDPAEYERALQEALPRLYRSFAPAAWQGSVAGPLRDAVPRTYAGRLPGASGRP
jgi:pyrimidine-specific ribonucleoside hydrolase